LKETEAPEILKDLGPLNGLPGDARFLPCVGKAPIYKEWMTDRSKWLTAEQVLRERNIGSASTTGTGLMTGSKVGRLCWLDFDGEETDEETGVVRRSASLDLENICGMSAEQLKKEYPTVISISGRPGRFRALYKVPENALKEFEGFSITHLGPTKSLDFLYEKNGGKQFHAVVEGDHPDGNNWFYRWEENYSPTDIDVAELPFPIMVGLIKARTRKLWKSVEATQEIESHAEDPSPMDYLSPAEQKKIIYKMMDYWPYRDGAKPTTFLGNHGDYDTMRRLVLSLIKGIGDMELFIDWIVDSPWDLKNDWSGERGSQRVNGGALIPWATSLINSEANGKPVKPWGAAWSLAVEYGWKPDKKLLPPKALTEGLLEKSAKLSVELSQSITAIEQSEVSPSQRLLAMQNLRKELKINKQDFTQLISTLQVELDGDKERSTTFAESMANRIKTEAIIPRLLAKGSVTLLAADGGVGKTAFLNKMSEALTTGKDFAGGFKIPEPCPILFVQKDEPESDAQDKWEAQGLEPDGSRFHMMWDFNPGMFPELRQKLVETGAKVMFMDSFGSLFGESGTSLNDAEMGLYVYMLNRLASELNIAIVVTHHLKKDQSRQRPGQPPTTRNVTKNDLYGSAYLVNGASSVWGMWKEQTNGFGPEEEDNAPTIILKVLKNRNGINETGEKFTFLGNKEDMSFDFVSMNGGTHTLTELDKLQNQMLKILSTKLEPATAVSLDELRGLLAGSFSQGAIRKEAKTLVKNAATTGIARVKGGSKKGGGNPGWKYYRPKI